MREIALNWSGFAPAGDLVVWAPSSSGPPRIAAGRFVVRPAAFSKRVAGAQTRLENSHNHLIRPPIMCVTLALQVGTFDAI